MNIYIYEKLNTSIEALAKLLHVNTTYEDNHFKVELVNKNGIYFTAILTIAEYHHYKSIRGLL